MEARKNCLGGTWRGGQISYAALPAAAAAAAVVVVVLGLLNSQAANHHLHPSVPLPMPPSVCLCGCTFARRSNIDRRSAAAWQRGDTHDVTL